jgi:hypothetical protein
MGVTAVMATGNVKVSAALCKKRGCMGCGETVNMRDRDYRYWTKAR